MVIGLVRFAYLAPIHKEFDAWSDAALTLYVPSVTTITSTVLSSRALRSAGIDDTVTVLTELVGAGVGVGAGVAVGFGEGVGVGEGVDVGSGVEVGSGVGVGVGVGTGVAVGGGVATAVAVATGV